MGWDCTCMIGTTHAAVMARSRGNICSISPTIVNEVEKWCSSVPYPSTKYAIARSG